ncbi:MAG TPA: hypothetical protein PLQ44_03865, partial [Candidatus Paceibacterota bacterium]|nr:hypothetical protein [Candidatus Paceibacterota bacterium]
FSPINSFKERYKRYPIIVSPLDCDFPLRVWLFYYLKKALTHVCVLMPIRTSNIGHFVNGVFV